MTIRELKIWIDGLISKVHNLPQVIYINWFGYQWFIKKDVRQKFYWQILCWRKGQWIWENINYKHKHEILNLIIFTLLKI